MPTREAWRRGLASFAIALTGMLLVAGWLSASSACWPLFVLVGVVAGIAAGRGRDIWVVWAALVVLLPVAAWLGLRHRELEWFYWVALTLVGACLATAGFAVGVFLAARAGRASAGTPGRLGGRGIGWPLLVVALAIGLLGFGGWVGYAAVEGSRELVHSTKTWPDCGTPAFVHGWEYEAINYDIADDARLTAAYPDMKECAKHEREGPRAGTEVVASDGVPIAGWYIPAASGVGPHGPTIVIVPGWKSHKAEVLKYAPPFHESFNLVLLDLRNSGRSGGDETTWGLGEALDVRAIVDWLERVKQPTWVGAMGNSLGASTALAAADEDPRIEALILDSMHASLVTSLGDGLEAEERLPAAPSAWAMVAGASLRVGKDLGSVDPVRTIGHIGERPVLLIHSRFDKLDRPEHSAEVNLRAGLAAGVSVELRYCDRARQPGDRHGKAIDDCPAEWAAWVSEFLAAAMSR